MPLTVLVVEDYLEVRELLATIFHLKGCTVLEAVDGRAAVEIATKGNIDLVLMDLNLPLMDGYEATRRILAHPSSNRVPIVAFSSDCGSERRERAFAAGCVECLSKPVGIEEIERVLDLAARRSIEDARGRSA
jgi:CheY-like chemotaxis protein